MEYFLHGVSRRQRAGEFFVGVLFAERLSAVQVYDSTGGYAQLTVRIALVGSTKGAGETFGGKATGQQGTKTDVAVEYLQHQKATPHCGLRFERFGKPERVEKSRLARFQRARKLIIALEFSAD